ncbi:hypothetical protein F4811DRAFT_556862 [Daldinia bambusicola]|nr:hypothetical protein F4811DRAFT_556862 [Daldinia bambusicola]
MDRKRFYESYSHFLPMNNMSHSRPSTSRRSSYYCGPGVPPQHPVGPYAAAAGNHQFHGEDQQQHQHQQRMAADQAYRATFASHERAVFQDEARARARRRDAARNRALFRGRLLQRPEFYAITLGVISLLWPIVNQYLIEPWVDKMNLGLGNGDQGDQE